MYLKWRHSSRLDITPTFVISERLVDVERCGPLERSFVVVAPFAPAFADRLRTSAMVPSSLSVRLLDFGIHPCNLQFKHALDANGVVHPSRFLPKSYFV